MERHYFTRGVAQSVVAVADAVGEDLQRLYGVSADLMTTIHNGFSPAEFSPERRHLLRSDVRAEFGYAESDVVALFAANELVRKGFDVLVEALAAVAQPRLQVLVVGRAPLTATQLGRLQALGLADRVTHAGTSGDMGRMHAAADLFVLPTQYEAFALAIVEALASGLPVITTEVPGAQDRIIDGTNGRLLRDPRSSAELAGLLRESMEPNRRSGWGDHAPGSVADLTWSSLTGQAELLLESLPLRII
jgi:UDP-glucose:(heptosyl)LPS alpha-1,3-glucosyltransferase